MKRTRRAETAPPPVWSELGPGERATFELPAVGSYAGGDGTLAVHVVRGSRPGPTLAVLAAVHGDEIGGVETVRRLLAHRSLRGLRGDLVAVPVVNALGFAQRARVLPDRRDLNRTFPGSARGSLAGRLAHQLLREVIDHASHAIDLHSASRDRSNLPQIRACLAQDGVRSLARAFGAPVVIDARLRPGSLRAEANRRGIPLIVYEGGEALRFDEEAVRAALGGTLRVMQRLRMIARAEDGVVPGAIASGDHWLRAPASGVLRTAVELGVPVRRGELLGVIAPPLSESETPVRAPRAGLIVGRTNLPLVHAGDALFHLAWYPRPSAVATRVSRFRRTLRRATYA